MLCFCVGLCLRRKKDREKPIGSSVMVLEQDGSEDFPVRTKKGLLRTRMSHMQLKN